MVSTGPARKTAALRIVRSGENSESASPIDFQLIVEQSLSLVVLTDADGVVEYVNPRFCEVTGYSSADVLGHRIHEFGELTPGQAVDIWQTVSAGRPWRGEFEATKKGGERYWVASCISPLMSEAGVITNFLSMNVDISERKLAEQQVEEREEFYRTLLEDGADVIAVLDNDGNVRYLSPSITRVLGYEVQELTGRQGFELIHPEDLPLVMDAFTRTVVGPNRDVSVIYRVRHKDGSWRAVESMSHPLPDATGIVVNFRDVTDREEALEALRASETRFRTVAESMYDIVSVVDSSGTIVYQSPSVERVLGFSADERMGTSTFEYVHPEDRELARGALNILMASSDGVQDLRLRVRHKDGSWRVLESVARARIGPNGGTEVIVTSRDVTERVQFEDSLRESEERLRTLLDNTPIVLFAWDEQGRFLASEGKGLELLGRAPGEVVGAMITDIYPPGSQVYENYTRALSGEVVVDVVEVGGRWWTATSTPFRDDAGGVIGVIGVALDITERRAAEIALEESQARLKLALDHAQMTAWEWDIERDELTDSAGEGSPLASYPQPLSYAGFLELVHPEDRIRVGESISRLFKEADAAYDVEFRIAWPDGSMHWVIASGVLIQDRDGKLRRLSGVAMDITARKQAEEALRESEARLRLALDGARMVTWEWDVVADSATHTAGDEELSYMSAPHSLDDFLSVIEEQDREAVRQALRRTVDEGAEYNVEFRLVRGRGPERWMFARGTPLFDGAGAVTRLVGVATDISERKRAEEALRGSEERYRKLYQDNPSMYFTVAREGTILSVNRFGAEILGYEESELVGRSVFDVFHKADRAAVRRQLLYLANDLEAVRSWEFRKVRKDGQEIWVREIVRATRDAEGQTIFLVVCEDITERRRIEDTMQALREQLERRADRAVAGGNRYNLSFREMTVLDQVADGKSDKEIGVVLGIRPMTVSKHVANVLKKMGAASRAEAGVRAWREGIIK